VCVCGATVPVEDAVVDTAGSPTLELRTICKCGRFYSVFVEPGDWSSQEDQGVPFEQ
jgi:hypothetical protein